MSGENLLRALRAVHEAEVRKAPKQHPLQTSQCPSLPRFAVAVWEGWTPEEEAHVSGCAYCQKIIAMERRLEGEPEPDDPPPAAAAPPAQGPRDRPASSEAPTEPAAPLHPGGPAGPEWGAAVRRVADLFVGGASFDEVAKQTNLTSGDIVAALFAARDRAGLAEALAEKKPAAGIRSAQPEAGEPESLADLLRRRSRTLRGVTVLPRPDADAGAGGEGSREERIRSFGRRAAPVLASLLSRASYAGVAWGRVVAAAVAGLERAAGPPPPRRREPLRCVATAGELVGEQDPPPESSSSLLAYRLAVAVNGSYAREHRYALHGVEAFVASLLGTDGEIDLVRRRISLFPNYQAIFGVPGRPGVIDRLDAIVTGCGFVHRYDPFRTIELPRLRMSLEKLSTLTYGNIGGVLLPREGLDAGDGALLEDVARRWTGATRAHYEQCARRDPGVILLAMMLNKAEVNKAEVVVKCVEAGLVTELIIDETLEAALWDVVGPARKHSRPAEVPEVGGKAAAPRRNAGAGRVD